MTRIAILGAGAIGSTLGAFLSRSGHSVTLIGRPDQVKAIRQEGLQVKGALGAFKVQLAAAEALEFQPDLAFLTVKTQDVLPTVQANQGFLANSLVVTFQNGVRSDEFVASLVPATQIISVVVNISASYLTPGKVTVIYPGSLVIGRPFTPLDAPVNTVAGILRQVTPTHVSKNILGAKWLKLIINLNNALPAVTSMSLGQIYADPTLRKIGVHLMREGLHIAQRAGIRLESLPDAPTALIKLLGFIPAGLAGRLLAGNVRRIETQQPIFGSTHQSLQRGRVTEIEYLNGEIVRTGKQLNVDTPYNESIVDLVHQVERTGEFLTVDAVRSALLHIQRVG